MFPKSSFSVDDATGRAHECRFACPDCGDGANYVTAEMLAWHRETSHPARVATPLVHSAVIPSSNYHHVLTSARHVRHLQHKLGIQDDELLGCNLMPFAKRKATFGGSSIPRPADFLALAHAMISERVARHATGKPDHGTALSDAYFDTWLPAFLPANKIVSVSMDNVRDVLASLCGDYSAALGNNDPLTRLATNALRELTCQTVPINGAANNEPVAAAGIVAADDPSMEFSDTESFENAADDNDNDDEAGAPSAPDTTDTSPSSSPPLLPSKSILRRRPRVDEPPAKRVCKRVEFNLPEKPVVFEYERDDANYTFRTPSRMLVAKSLAYGL